MENNHERGEMYLNFFLFNNSAYWIFMRWGKERKTQVCWKESKEEIRGGVRKKNEKIRKEDKNVREELVENNKRGNNYKWKKEKSRENNKKEKDLKTRT